MATYLELHEMHSDIALIARTEVAVIKAAQAINVEDSSTANHINRLVWAKEVLINPAVAAKAIYRLVLAVNSDATVNQIQNASDSELQSNVNTAINLFATGA